MATTLERIFKAEFDLNLHLIQPHIIIQLFKVEIQKAADGGAEKTAKIFLKAKKSDSKGDESGHHHKESANAGAKSFIELTVGDFTRFTECGAGFFVNKRVGDF